MFPFFHIFHVANQNKNHMKKILRLLVPVLFCCFAQYAQAQTNCSPSQAAGLLVTTIDDLAFSDPFVVKTCNGAVCYDTVNASRTHYLEPGATLYLFTYSTTLVYMKTGSTITLIGPNVNAYIYTEANTTINGTPMAPPSPCVSITFPGPSCTTGMTDVNNGIPFSLFPQPAADVLNIQRDENSPADYVVIDITGRIVLTGTLNENLESIGLAGLAPGLFTIQLTSKDGRRSSMRFMHSR
ncbi:MAG: hypothetical protein FD123_1005 [Bacteroidetes bacterium]|nr:MAG: hypothetical protein FD123_1005 [Bacteroidota bacterium]